MARCKIHNDVPIPKQALEHHHIHPTAYGGPDVDENICTLCASCHTAVHRIAQKIYSGKNGEARDITAQYLPDQPARQEKLLTLSQEVVKARRLHVRNIKIPEVDPTEQTNDTVKMSLDVPAWLHHRLKTLAIGTGLYRYVIHVLANHAVVATTKPGADSKELFGINQVDFDNQPSSDHDFDFTHRH